MSVKLILFVQNGGRDGSRHKHSGDVPFGGCRIEQLLEEVVRRWKLHESPGDTVSYLLAMLQARSDLAEVLFYQSVQSHARRS